MIFTFNILILSSALSLTESHWWLEKGAGEGKATKLAKLAGKAAVGGSKLESGTDSSSGTAEKALASGGKSLWIGGKQYYIVKKSSAKGESSGASKVAGKGKGGSTSSEKIKQWAGKVTSKKASAANMIVMKKKVAKKSKSVMSGVVGEVDAVAQGLANQSKTDQQSHGQGQQLSVLESSATNKETTKTEQVATIASGDNKVDQSLQQQQQYLLQQEQQKLQLLLQLQQQQQKLELQQKQQQEEKLRQQQQLEQQQRQQQEQQQRLMLLQQLQLQQQQAQQQLQQQQQQQKLVQEQSRTVAPPAIKTTTETKAATDDDEEEGDETANQTTISKENGSSKKIDNAGSAQIAAASSSVSTMAASVSAQAVVPSDQPVVKENSPESFLNKIVSVETPNVGSGAGSILNQIVNEQAGTQQQQLLQASPAAVESAKSSSLAIGSSDLQTSAISNTVISKVESNVISNPTQPQKEEDADED